MDQHHLDMLNALVQIYGIENVRHELDMLETHLAELEGN